MRFATTSSIGVPRNTIRFFKSNEDPLDQHFGLDTPENVGTFRIVGIVKDAKFAGWGLDKPARPEPVNGWLCRGVTCLQPIGDLVNLKEALKEQA